MPALRYETPRAVAMARRSWPSRPKNQHTAGDPMQRLMGALAFDETDCWYFRGSHTDLGYGVMHAVGEKRAHRVAWVLFHGPIPAGMHVLHRCDVRCCVNPDHLFLGTHGDNMRDMAAKGRLVTPALCGAKNPTSKLNPSAVQEIRHRYTQGGVSQAALAAQYGVATMTVNRVINQKTWVKND